MSQVLVADRQMGEEDRYFWGHGWYRLRSVAHVPWGTGPDDSRQAIPGSEAAAQQSAAPHRTAPHHTLITHTTHTAQHYAWPCSSLKGSRAATEPLFLQGRGREAFVCRLANWGYFHFCGCLKMRV